MAKNRDAEVITLGSGDLHCIEYNGSNMPADAAAIIAAATNDNILGRIKGGCTLEYEGEWYTAKDDTGKVSKTLITSETVTMKSGVITWNGQTLEVLCSTARVVEAGGYRTVKLGGTDNYNGKSYVLIFHHKDPVDGDVWVMIRGNNQGGISLAFVKDEETTIDAEFTALPDEDGTLVTYVEQMTDPVAGAGA